MLGSVIVAEIHCFFGRPGLNQDTLCNGLAHDICPWKSSRLRINLFLDFDNRFWGKVHCEEDDLGVNAMFGLREEIGSDECWIGGFIGNDLSVCEGPDSLK